MRFLYETFNHLLRTIRLIIAHFFYQSYFGTGSHTNSNVTVHWNDSFGNNKIPVAYGNGYALSMSKRYDTNERYSLYCPWWEWYFQCIHIWWRCVECPFPLCVHLNRILRCSGSLAVVPRWIAIDCYFECVCVCVFGAWKLCVCVCSLNDFFRFTVQNVWELEALRLWDSEILTLNWLYCVFELDFLIFFGYDCNFSLWKPITLSLKVCFEKLMPFLGQKCFRLQLHTHLRTVKFWNIDTLNCGVCLTREVAELRSSNGSMCRSRER